MILVFYDTLQKIYYKHKINSLYLLNNWKKMRDYFAMDNYVYTSCSPNPNSMSHCSASNVQLAQYSNLLDSGSLDVCALQLVNMYIQILSNYTIKLKKLCLWFTCICVCVFSSRTLFGKAMFSICRIVCHGD